MFASKKRQLQVFCRLILALKDVCKKNKYIMQCAEPPIDQCQRHLQSFWQLQGGKKKSVYNLSKEL